MADSSHFEGMQMKEMIEWMPWLMSLLSVISLIKAGSKSQNAWLWMLAAQVLWLIWIPISKNWGLLPGAVAYTAVAVRNHYAWKN